MSGVTAEVEHQLEIAGPFDGRVPDDTVSRRKVLRLNAAKLYNFDVEKLAPLAQQFGPTAEEIETPLPREEIPRDSGCYLFQNALYGL